MTQDEIIEMARQAGMEVHSSKGQIRIGSAVFTGDDTTKQVEAFAKLVAAKERESLEAELLKLKKGVAANSEYIQGRWDLIGEFQDIIRARGDNQ